MLKTLPPLTTTTLNHLLYFFAFGKKVLEMEKIYFDCNHMQREEFWVLVDFFDQILL